jgi:hypothetical protein
MDSIIDGRGISISPISKRLLSLVEAGVAVLHLTISKDGYEMLVSPSKQYPQLGLEVHKKYLLEEFLDLSRKIQILDTKQVKAKGKEPAFQSVFYRQRIESLEDAKVLNDFGTLSVVETRGGLKNQLPQDSLTYWDLGREFTNELQARAFLVADKIGTPTLVGRIRGVKELHVPNANSLKDWWMKATSVQKWILLTSRSKRGKTSPSMQAYKEGLTPAWSARLDDLQCPFRDPESYLEEQISSEGEEVYEGGISFSSVE